MINFKNFKIGLPGRLLGPIMIQAPVPFSSNPLNWDDLITPLQKRKATLMFKTINGLTPVYLQNLFSTRSTRYNLRDSEAKLELPTPRTNYGKRTFCYSEALLWNNLPISLRKSESLGYFKREIDQLYGSSRLGSHTAIL